MGKIVREQIAFLIRFAPLAPRVKSLQLARRRYLTASGSIFA